MIISLSDIQSKIIRGDMNVIKEILSVRVPNYQHSMAYKKHHWDGFYRFFNTSTHTFPTGLIPRLLNEYKGTAIIQDRRSQIRMLSESTTHTDYLRDYQKKDLLKLINNNLTNNPYVISGKSHDLPFIRGTFAHTTGSGKSYLIRALSEWDMIYILIISPNISNITQLYRFLIKYIKENIGVIGAGEKSLSRITLITPQSLGNIINKNRDKILADKLINHTDLILIDEVHNVSKISGQLYKALNKIKTGMRVGFTGTAELKSKYSNMCVEATTGEVIGEVGHKELVEKDLLSDVEFHIYETSSGLAQFTDRWMEVRKRSIIQNSHKNNIILKKCQEFVYEKRPVLIFVDIISHGHLLNRLLSASHINSIFIMGEDTPQIRYHWLRKLNNHKLDVLIATQIFKEGINIPNLSAIILASEGKAPIKLLQQIGRGVRKGINKTNLTIMDFYNKSHRYTEQHSLERIQLYKNRGFKVYEKAFD